MGTRSLTRVFEDGKCLVAIYQQYDGYPSGVGSNLKKFLENMDVVDGFSNEKEGTHANGVGCLAAQLIKYLKKEIGGVYIMSKDAFQEWNYDLSTNEKGEVLIKVFTGDLIGQEEEIKYAGLIKKMPTDDKHYYND